MNHDASMLTPQEVAKILGVHTKTVHQWLRSGKLGGIKISYRAWRIPRATLEQFIEKNKNVNEDTPAAKMLSDYDPHRDRPQETNEREESPMKQYLQVIMGESKKSRISKDQNT